VSVDVYSSYTDTGSSITFSGTPEATGTLTSTALGFAVNMDAGTSTPLLGIYDANTSFGADFKGTLVASTAGTYTGSVSSDDGSYLFIDGSLVASDGGTHGYQTVNFSDVLSAGAHSFEVQYYNGPCCGAGVGFALTSSGISVGGGVPEPSTWAMMMVGFAGLGFAGYRRSKAAPFAA
jgi:hypothetical protein